MDWEDVKILLELQVIVVVLIDMSGAIDELKARLRRWLHIRGEITLKPLDCSFCMYHWTALVVMLCLGRLTLTAYMAICLLALATRITESALSALAGGIIWAIDNLRR